VDAEANPLELDRDELAAMIEEAGQRVVDHLADLDEQPAADVDDASELAERFREPEPPREGASFEALMDELFEEAIPASLNTPHPGYLAYIPGGGLPHAAVADLVSDATNRYVGTWFAAPALARIEANVVDWLCSIVDYPHEAFGLLTTGGSMANQIAITTARREVLGEDFLDGTVYVSDQVHHSVSKSCVLSGLPADQVRAVPTDEHYRLDVDALREQVRRDREDGYEPFLLVANAGSTNTGAVDPLHELADLADEEDVWLHADAAYGGFFTLTDRGAERLGGMQRADSITLDPHKGLFLPYGTGSVLVRDVDALARSHAVDADYIPDWDPEAGAVDFSQLSPELSRDFRGLRVWLPLKMHGLKAFEANLDEKLDLAEHAHERLSAMEDVEILAEPQLSTLAFRLNPDGVPEAELDELNQAWTREVNDRARVHLSGTQLDERFAVRISVVSFRTHREHVEEGLADLEAAIDDVLASQA
jgi:aromatic-L-amino-acid decarboxylase